MTSGFAGSMKSILLNQRRWFLLLALVLIGLAGSRALLLSTPYGLGLINDTAAYVDGANNLIKGLGYVRTAGSGSYKAFTNYPPLFSISLLPLQWFGLDVFQSGRFLIAALFGMDALLVGLLVYRISHSILFSLMGAVLLAYSDTFLEVYANLLSEPLFITLLLLAFFTFLLYWEQCRRLWLVITGLVLDIACLTRYVGISAVASFAIVLVLLQTNWRYLLTGRPGSPFRGLISWRRLLSKEASFPLMDSAVFLVSSLLFIMIWMVYTYFVTGSLGNRSVVWHPLDFSVLLEGMKGNLDWLVSRKLAITWPVITSFFHVLSLLLIPGLIVFLIEELGRRFRAGATTFSGEVESGAAFNLAFYIIFYILFLIVSISLFDASTPMNIRILSPALILLIVLFSSGLAWLFRFANRLNATPAWGLRLVVAFICIGVVYSGIKDGSIAINNLRQDGLGFAQRSLAGSKTIQYVRNLSPVNIFTNKPAVIFLLTGKYSTIIPTEIDPVNNQPSPEFDSEVQTLREDVSTGQAILILFDATDQPDPGLHALYQTLTVGLHLQHEFGKTQIYSQAK